MSKRFVDPALFGSLCLVFLISLLWQLSVPAHAQVQPQGSSVSAPKTIVLLYSYGDGLLAYQLATRAFLSIMEEGAKEGVVSEKSLFFEYLDLERKKDKEHYKNLTTLLLHKYATQKIDLIVTVHGPALKFLLNEGRDLSPGTPVLSYLGPDTIETTGIERRVVLLPMSMDFYGTLQLAQKLFPQTMRVVFVNGIGEGEKRLEREAKSVFAQWPDKLEFEYTSDLSVEEMLQRIATLSPGTIVIYSNVFTDRTGRNFVARDVAEMVVKAANVPVFGMYNTLLGKGIIGGSVFNFEAEGARAGMLALDILRGKLPLSKPATVLPVSRKPMFDWQQLKRWEVRISRLPEGSMIVNRPPTVWSHYKEYVIIVIGFCLGQLLLIIALIIQKRRMRSAEESLRQRTEELDQFFNVSLDLLCIANTDSYFLRLNPAWERILGFTREELVAKQFLDFVHPEDLDRTREAVSTLASSQEVFSFENRYRCKDGTYRLLEWRSAPVGKLIYAAARDLTERKRTEAEAAHARAELLHVERSMRLNELTASLAHELNQPLTAILSNAQAALRFLKAEKPDLNEIWEILRDIISDDQRAGNVIRSLRSMMRREEGEKRPIDLNDILSGVIQIFRSEAVFRNVHIEIELDESIPPVLGDKGQLQQVVLNTVMNAAEAMSGSPPDRRKLILRTRRKDHSIGVAVRDFGPGIDKENLERVFEPFFTTKRAGLGIGLSVCSSIIKAHRGRIWAENHPDGGATFFIELPVYERSK